MTPTGTYSLTGPATNDANLGNGSEYLKCGDDASVTVFTQGMGFVGYSCNPMFSSLKSKVQLHDDNRIDAYGWRGAY
jgi:hypothetical protein